MNEFMRVSPVGLKLIAEFEGAPRTKARLCEGGRYELSYGCTTWPDGRPVMAGETCTEDQALILFAFHLHRFEAVVKKHIKVELNQYQFDACVALAYNVGPEQFATSTVVSCMNEKRWDDAAAAFSRFVYATKKASQRTDKEPLEWFLAPQEYEPQTYDAEGKPLPLVPLPRKQVPYRRALRGLLRRHMAEGLVSLGMPYEDACNDEAIRMRTERVWNAKHGRNEDLVRMQTEWDEVRAVALEKPRLPLPEMPDLEVADVPFDLDAWEAKEKAWLASLPIDWVELRAPSPFSLPLMVERFREKLTTEKLADRLTMEHDPQIGRVKDMGSAAVAVAAETAPLFPGRIIVVVASARRRDSS